MRRTAAEATQIVVGLDGQDVAGVEPGSGPSCCRLYDSFDGRSGVPSVALIRTAPFTGSFFWAISHGEAQPACRPRSFVQRPSVRRVPRLLARIRRSALCAGLGFSLFFPLPVSAHGTFSRHRSFHARLPRKQSPWLWSVCGRTFGRCVHPLGKVFTRIDRDSLHGCFDSHCLLCIGTTGRERQRLPSARTALPRTGLIQLGAKERLS